MNAAQLAPSEQFPWLTALEQERFVRAVERSLKVRSKSQFFVWAQGAVHGLLPHSMLICACGLASELAVVERFSDFPVPDEQFEEMCRGPDGLLAQIIQWWREGGGEPRLLSDSDSTGQESFKATLQRYNLENLAVHGTTDLKDDVTSFFTFSGIPGPLNGRHRHILELLLPYLHTTMLRFVQNERSAKVSAPVLKHLLTAREIEILRWVQQGKSNAEIGHVLRISPLTVKNHVQNVLRKLNVHNRAQAVAKGHSLRILGCSSPF
jgi:transcriptional regulator EpsA